VDAVRVLTIHSAKGLEFPVVFVAAIHKGVNNRPSELNYAPGIGLGAQWRNPLTGEAVSDFTHDAVWARQQQKEAQEANRLLYVAMTRAEEHLVLSFSRGARMRSSWASMLEDATGMDLSTPGPGFRVEYLKNTPVAVLCTDQPPEALGPPASGSPVSPVEFVDRPAVTGRYDSAASVTSVARFAHCPRRYYLDRYLGWSEEESRHLRPDDEQPETRDELSAMDASEFGRQVHALLADLKVANPHPEAEGLAERFHNSELGRRRDGASRVEREFDFVFALEDVVLQGQIDLWFEENGELVLVDYKTDQASRSKP